jgi:uncharacterized membrane protein YidH (DUF202 family)
MSVHDYGDDGGLQAERTHLSWTRTSLAVVANGVLVLLKHPLPDERHVPWAVAALVAVTAAAIYLVGVHRQRELTKRPLPRRITARGRIVGVGVATLALSVIVLAHLLLPAA